MLALLIFKSFTFYSQIILVAYDYQNKEQLFP